MKKTVKTLALLPLVLLVACGPHATPVSAESQSGSFSVNLHEKSVGNANFQIAPASGGLNSTSLVRVNMKGLNYAFSKNEQLSPASQLQHVQLSATINGEAVSVSAAPDSAQMLINISANGHSTTTRLAAHPAAVFLPDFDPGALQTLLNLAARQNNRDLWAIVPKQSGSVDAVTLATYADQQGTLNGRPVTVHHLVATIAGNVTELFSGPQNQLLQAELSQQGFALVRTGFVLSPPSNPGAPPVPPTSSGQQAPAGQQQTAAPQPVQPQQQQPATPQQGQQIQWR